MKQTAGRGGASLLSRPTRSHRAEHDSSGPAEKAPDQALWWRNIFLVLYYFIALELKSKSRDRSQDDSRGLGKQRGRSLTERRLSAAFAEGKL